MMNFLKHILSFFRKKPGTGQGQIFKEGIKAMSFEVYRGVSVLVVLQLEKDVLSYKYLFYTSRVSESDEREDTMHSGTGADLDQCKTAAYKAIDKLDRNG